MYQALVNSYFQQVTLTTSLAILFIGCVDNDSENGKSLVFLAYKLA